MCSHSMGSVEKQFALPLSLSHPFLPVSCPPPVHLCVLLNEAREGFETNDFSLFETGDRGGQRREKQTEKQKYEVVAVGSPLV